MIAPDRTSSTPHFTAAPVMGRTVIIHATRSGISGHPMEMASTLNHFANPYPNEPNKRASAQWVIGRDGEKVRVVPDNQQAWHAQEDNDITFGIELCQGVEADGFTGPQLLSLVLVCRGYVQDFGVPPVHATSSMQPGFIGHQETAQGKRNGKSDPGALFPWADFLSCLGVPETGTVPSFEKQVDSLVAEAARVSAFRQGREVRPLDDTQYATFEWLYLKEKAERGTPP